MLERSIDEEKFINYAYLQLFLIIEDYLNNDFIFQEGRKKCYVLNNNKHIRVLNYKKEDDKRFKHYESSISFINHNYNIVKGAIKFRRIDVYYKMSAVLIYKFGFNNSNVLGWNKISQIRNSKAAHSGVNNLIEIDEIIMILDFLCFIIDESRSNIKNINKSLDMDDNVKLDLLTKKYNPNIR